MSRTVRRKGWTYWESNKRFAKANNPFFGNKGWLSRTDYHADFYAWLAGERVGFSEEVSAFIHRDLKKGWRYEVFMGYIHQDVRQEQKRGLHKVMKGYDYLIDEAGVRRAKRGIAEWCE